MACGLDTYPAAGQDWRRMERGTLTDSIAAAQAWWREAGVDLVFHDAPQPWLAPEAEERAAEAPVVVELGAVEPKRPQNRQPTPYVES